MKARLYSVVTGLESALVIMHGCLMCVSPDVVHCSSECVSHGKNECTTPEYFCDSRSIGSLCSCAEAFLGRVSFVKQMNIHYYTVNIGQTKVSRLKE